TDKLESEAGSIFSPSRIFAEKTAVPCPMSLFRKQKRRYHPIPPPSKPRESSLFQLANMHLFFFLR
ncbi:MAG: hypothetical protein ACXVAB_12140, partial [Thermodesulfobacteriota bacterium]